MLTVWFHIFRADVAVGDTGQVRHEADGLIAMLTCTSLIKEFATGSGPVTALLDIHQ